MLGRLKQPTVSEALFHEMFVLMPLLAALPELVTERPGRRDRTVVGFTG
jgi:hypothetical protein